MPSHKLRYLGMGFAAVTLTGAMYACGTDAEDATFYNSSKGGSAGSNTDASANGGAAGTVTGNGGSSGTIFMDAALGDQGMSSETACAAAHVEATGLPLDLYLMVDRSGSMDSNNKWQNQEAALKTFINDPKSAGLWIAMGFFPKNDSYNMSPNCNGSLYATPKVQWAELPGSANTLISAVAAEDPNGSFTPTTDALNGVLKGAKDRQLQQPMHVVAAVIVSDGKPCCYEPDYGTEYGCAEETSSGIGAIAAQYAAGTPPIKTFAIYVDDSASDVMKAIASKGGTGTPYDATGGTSAFVAALEKIKGQALGCEYKVPEADGGKANPALVDVQYTPGAGGDPIGYPKVNDQNACGSDVGWYYDNNADPQKIILCPTSCDTVKKDDKGKLDILLGCTPDTR